MNQNMSSRWTTRPEGSTWGDFGPNDVFGRLNLIDASKIRAGVAEVITGEAFTLGLPLNLPGRNVLNPNRFPLVLRPNLRQGSPNVNFPMRNIHEGATDILNDDLVLLHTQYSTQWDAFGHAGSLFDANGDGVPEPVFYNGYRAGVEVVGTEEAKDCGIPVEPLGDHTSTVNLGPVGIGALASRPVQGRAVLVDFAYHFGSKPRSMGYDDLMHVINADNLIITSGDVLLIHTGYARELIAMNGNPDPDVLHQFGASLDGRDGRLLQWITDMNIAAIAADNYAVETYPAKKTEGDAAILPLHEHCLFKLGVLLGELWFLSDLASTMRKYNRFACLLSASPLNIPGASGSPLNPIATI